MHLLRLVASVAALALVAAPLILGAPLDTPPRDYDMKIESRDVGIQTPLILPGNGLVPHEALRNEFVVRQLRWWLGSVAFAAPEDVSRDDPLWASFDFFKPEKLKDLEVLDRYFSDEDLVVLRIDWLQSFLSIVTSAKEVERLPSFPYPKTKPQEYVRAFKLRAKLHRKILADIHADMKEAGITNIDELAQKQRDREHAELAKLAAAAAVRRKPIDIKNRTTTTETGVRLERRLDKYDDPNYQIPGRLRSWVDKFWEHGTTKWCLLWKCKKAGKEPEGKNDPEKLFNGRWSHHSSGGFKINWGFSKTLFQWLSDHTPSWIPFMGRGKKAVKQLEGAKVEKVE